MSVPITSASWNRSAMSLFYKFYQSYVDGVSASSKYPTHMAHIPKITVSMTFYIDMGISILTSTRANIEDTLRKTRRS